MSVRAVIAVIIFGVLLIGSVIVFIAAAPAATASFGWFAYQPLAAQTYLPGVIVVLSPLMLTAATIGVAGLVGLSVMAGYGIGQRRRTAR